MGVEPRAIDPSPFKRQAHAMRRPGQPPDGPDPEPARDGGAWRGPTEAGWIDQLLHGAPLPRESVHPAPGPMAHR